MNQSLFSPSGRKPLPAPINLLPLDEMVARIEAIRAEEADDRCPTCGTASKPTGYKRCTGCGVTRPLSLFGVDRRWNTPRSWCLPCDAARRKEVRSRKALRAIRRSA